MKSKFKPHLLDLKRYQTSVGRDISKGVLLDRNERMIPFENETLVSIYNSFDNNVLNIHPEPHGLYKKIANSINVDVEQIYITNGITEGIKVLYESLTNPNDNVVVLDPTYPMYHVYAKMYQLEYRKLEYTDKLLVDIDNVEDLIDERTKILAIANPNLPIESALDRKQIEKIAQCCKEKDILFAVDEAYHYFGAESAMSLIEKYDNLVVMRSFSKAFGLAGIRLGYMVSNIENIVYFSKMRGLTESNSLSMAVAEYMLDNQEIMRDYVALVKNGSEYLKNEIEKLNLKWHGGDYTNGILIFLNDKDETQNLINYMKNKNIYIRGSFEFPIENCIRVSLGPVKCMSMLIDEIKNWMNRSKND
jgi:histidinol-phosphate aminotransferase